MATSKAKKDEVAVTGPGKFNPAVDSWDTVRNEADEVLGHDLAKDELFDALAGVPFIITAVTYRPGFTRKVEGGDKTYAYVSCEAFIAPELELKRRRIDLDMLPFRPEDKIIFNDGSTGVSRQVTQYLAVKEFITLPEGPTEGPMGDSIYDLPPQDWADIHHGELYFNEDGFGIYSADIRLYAPRGIRLSEYTNEWSPNGAKTRYLA